jgi:hypothetical protein
MTITEFHENRLSVDILPPGQTAPEMPQSDKRGRP